MKPCACAAFFLALVAGAALAGADETAPVDFDRDIRPLLADNCFACHGPDEKVREAELRLDLEEGVFGRKTPVVVRGKADASDLYQRIMSTDPDEHMPPAESNKSLTDAQKELIRRWIDQGAKWQTHWAYVKPVRSEPPAAKTEWRVHNAVDQFIQARLEVERLSASPEADRVTLIRRLYFDLIGLPPTPAEVAAFVHDESPQAYAPVVEHLLESPHFGERLAIYWLDVVRYADSNGYHSDEPRKSAPYRDYVIAAFNSNKPFDQFVVEQLAGDLLPEATTEQQVASGFNMLLQTTSEGGAQAKEYLAKYSADRVRNTSQIFLGSTMGCCECHSHKFDPLTQKDFYSLAAFFADIQQAGVGNPPTYPVMMPADRDTLAAFDRQLGELRKTADTSTPELAAAQETWQAAIVAQLTTTPEFGPWFLIGPFQGTSFDEAHAKAFLDPARVDVTGSAGELKWQKQEQFVDGKIHNFSGEANVARYLFRTVRTASAAELKLSFGSDDSLTVWLNGKLVHDNKVGRGVTLDQDKVTVPLSEGENQLLLKICNGAGGSGFAFNTERVDLPAPIAAILKAAASERNEAQKHELAKFYRSIAPLLQPVREQTAKLEQERKQFEEGLPRTLMTKAGEQRVIRFLNRGNWMDDSGPEMQPAIPEFLGSLNVEGRRANRLDLAKWIVDRDNPLTARTFINRLWKLYFGQGLATPLDDLGRQGTQPTHPQLMDWLAVEFRDSGWNVKHMIRLLVTSHTYRQSSLIPPDLKKRDPDNKLYARQSRFRLDAEIVRDNALAISGLLVKDFGGRSVHPYQPAGYWRHMNFPAREWPTDTGANLYRRGVYTWWQRMFLHPSLVAFDAPSREECTVERPRSNIPQQALVLLNDPTYVEASRAFAERIIAEGGSSVDERLNWAFQQALSRNAETREAAVLRRIYEKQIETYRSNTDAAKGYLGVGARPLPTDRDPAELAAWTSVGRVILNLHEMITRS